MAHERLILRDYLARDRTLLANERTILAYARTALMMLVTGITLLKLFPGDLYMTVSGYILIPTSLLLGAFGYLRFRKMNRIIQARETTDLDRE